MRNFHRRMAPDVDGARNPVSCVGARARYVATFRTWFLQTPKQSTVVTSGDAGDCGGVAVLEDNRKTTAKT